MSVLLETERRRLGRIAKGVTTEIDRATDRGVKTAKADISDDSFAVLPTPTGG